MMAEPEKCPKCAWPLFHCTCPTASGCVCRGMNRDYCAKCVRDRKNRRLAAIHSQCAGCGNAYSYTTDNPTSHCSDCIPTEAT